MLSVSELTVLLGLGGLITIGGSSSSSMFVRGVTSISLQLAAKSVITNARRNDNFLIVFMLIVFKVDFCVSGFCPSGRACFPCCPGHRAGTGKGFKHTSVYSKDITKVTAGPVILIPTYSLVFPNFSFVFLKTSLIANNLTA